MQVLLAQIITIFDQKEYLIGVIYHYLECISIVLRYNSIII